MYRWRTRRLARRYDERMQERLAERERIARALHDTLLQNMQGLILRFQGVAKRLPSESDALRRIGPILDQATTVMAQGRSELMDLRTATDQGEDLATALGTFGRSLSEDLGPRFTLAVTGDARPVAATARHEIYCIGREALFNAYRHADAGHVEVELAYSRDDFGLSVRDDGAGMPEDILRNAGKEGHWGLAGMRERAAALGGSLALRRRQPAGTEVCLQLPAHRVYPHQGQPALLPRLRALCRKMAAGVRA